VLPNGTGPAGIVPDGVEPSFPVCKTGVVAVGPRDCKWTHWESHPDLKRAELVSSCWTMSPSCGSWNRTNIKTFRASRPTVRRSRNCCFFCYRPALGRHWRPSSVASSGGRNRTYGILIQSQASLPTATTPEWNCIFKVPCGNRTRLASLEGWNLCRSAKGTRSGRGESRTHKAYRSTVFETAAIASWLALPCSFQLPPCARSPPATVLGC
jgi:hypothetical protein